MTGPPDPAVLRVLVCDDNDLLRDVLTELLAAQPDLEPAGSAADTDDAVRLVTLLRPHVVVLDVRFPGGGPETARRIAHTAPDTGILAFSAYADAGTVASMRSAGAREYLVKGATNAEFLAAVRRVGRPSAALSPPGPADRP
ncbi:response regulator [Actinacidiphila sp. ITFR-21]|uniref:response regulator n=1 Tax=Actinacidiphila sp. ITFR-21 TaxID=3075199 RepID=UPI00288B8BF1|nr:response regulator transcription factor [Streptomyces sp. ITFR-21]WNI14143.1 response regulator transcription factor [Streptomyces sp. ITFR-21]